MRDAFYLIILLLLVNSWWIWWLASCWRVTNDQGFQKKVVGGVGMIKPWLIIIIMVHDHDDNDDKTLKTEAAAAS